MFDVFRRLQAPDAVVPMVTHRLSEGVSVGCKVLIDDVIDSLSRVVGFAVFGGVDVSAVSRRPPLLGAAVARQPARATTARARTARAAHAAQTAQHVGVEEAEDGRHEAADVGECEERERDAEDGVDDRHDAAPLSLRRDVTVA